MEQLPPKKGKTPGLPFPLPEEYREFDTGHYPRYNFANPENNAVWNGIKFGELITETFFSTFLDCSETSGIVINVVRRSFLRTLLPKMVDNARKFT